jgi:Cu(I)/Ag(I) efflux system membrane protein CusA/SilA
VFMLLYLDLAWEDARRKGRIRSMEDLRRIILTGAAMRIRPKFMTTMTVMAGLLPVFWSAGPGSDLMKRIAAPMAGGMTSSFLLELLIYPVLYSIWRRRQLLSAVTAPVRPGFITAVMPPIFLASGRRPFNGNDQLLK